MSRLEALQELPDPAGYRAGQTVWHPFWEISENPRRVMLELTRDERTWRMETWELDFAVYSPASSGRIKLTPALAHRIELATRHSLPLCVSENSPESLMKSGHIEGIGHVNATYRKRASERVEPVWVDPEGKVR